MNLQTLSTLVGLVVLAVTWLILQPLKVELATLSAAIKQLTETVKDNQVDIVELKVVLSSITQDNKAINKRLAKIEGQIDNQ